MGFHWRFVLLSLMAAAACLIAGARGFTAAPPMMNRLLPRPLWHLNSQSLLPHVGGTAASGVVGSTTRLLGKRVGGGGGGGGGGGEGSWRSVGSGRAGGYVRGRRHQLMASCAAGSLGGQLDRGLGMQALGRRSNPIYKQPRASSRQRHAESSSSSPSPLPLRMCSSGAGAEDGSRHEKDTAELKVAASSSAGQVGVAEDVVDAAEEKVCTVRRSEDEPHMVMHFDVGGKERMMSRMQEDEVETSLVRLGRLWAEGMGFGGGGGRGKRKKGKGKGKGKGKKRRQAAAEAEAEAEAEGDEPDIETPPEVPIEVVIRDVGGEPVDPSTPNRDAWKQGRKVTIVRGDAQQVYRIVENPPTVTLLGLDAVPMVGYQIAPRALFEYADADEAAWRWLRRADVSGFGRLEVVSEEESYTPSREDLGAGLVVECVPARKGEGGGGGDDVQGSIVRGESCSMELGRQVADGPDLSVFSPRFKHAENADPEADPSLLRVVSYNILADAYCNTQFARETLYAYCPQRFLEEGYRKQVFVREILEYRASVVCLQEVTQELFETYLLPSMRRGGYDGSYTNKLGISSIGCATFWRASLFTAAETRAIDLANGWKEHDDLAKLCSGSDPARIDMSVALERSTTVAQAVMLEGVGGRKLVVVNTHLFGHPDATHVRLVQSAVMARGVEEIVSLEGWSEASLVVCGDLNSLPEEGVCDFFVDGGVGVDHEDWWRGLKFENIMSRQEREARWFEDKTHEDEKSAYAGRKFENYDTRPCLNIQSPIGPFSRASQHVEATISMSAGPRVVDHIFYSNEGLAEDQNLFPALSVEDLTSDGGLPSARFASDHAALVTDLRWKEPK